MQWEDNGQGALTRNLSGKLAYDSFSPTPLQNIVPLSLDNETVDVLAACAGKLGELEGMMGFVPNAGMYLAMYVRKEALLSAQIEGTQCTFDDILNPDNSQLTQRDVSDVISYVKATNYAVDRMNKLPLCTRLLSEVHEILLEGTRGKEKNPGQTRVSQNWIGPTGCTLTQAAYVPPNVEDMKTALGDLDRFINEEDRVNAIVKAALIHYQFETIHPFLDGNGRLGRLLVTLSLLNDNAISKAVFYPSYQFKLNRTKYYEALMNVRQYGRYSEWVGFFCRCLLASAEDAVIALKKLIDLKERNNTLITDSMGRSAHNGLRLLDLLEGNPIVTVTFVADSLSLSRAAANNLVNAFAHHGILVQQESERQRYRTFLYEEYLGILRQGSDPL